MMHLSHLEGTPVVTEAGEHLGRVWEIRSPGKARSEPEREQRPIGCFVCGRLGLLERLGWRERAAFAIPWTAVVARKSDKLVVQGGINDYERIGRAAHRRQRAKGGARR